MERLDMDGEPVDSEVEELDEGEESNIPGGIPAPGSLDAVTGIEDPDADEEDLFGYDGDDEDEEEDEDIPPLEDEEWDSVDDIEESDDL